MTYGWKNTTYNSDEIRAATAEYYKGKVICPNCIHYKSLMNNDAWGECDVPIPASVDEYHREDHGVFSNRDAEHCFYFQDAEAGAEKPPDPRSYEERRQAAKERQKVKTKPTGE